MTHSNQRKISSPVGSLVLSAAEAGLTRLHIASIEQTLAAPAPACAAAIAHLDAAEAALAEYFEGSRKRFDDLTLAPRGSDFQRTVWSALEQIPFGQTSSYGQLAARIGNPRASRAVGMANNRNPIGIIVPCHRVIGADGRLVGYAGGLPMKQWLLRHEGADTGELFDR